MRHAQEAATDVMKALRVFVASAPERPLPTEVLEKTKQHILIMLACMISGTTLKPGRLAAEMARSHGGAAQACVPGTNLVGLGEIASFVNGMTARAGESDDVHTRSRAHPGASVVPAALAMAEPVLPAESRCLAALITSSLSEA